MSYRRSRHRFVNGHRITNSRESIHKKPANRWRLEPAIDGTRVFIAEYDTPQQACRVWGVVVSLLRQGFAVNAAAVAEHMQPEY